jgi:membrane associated rhomboid family serine protease
MFKTLPPATRATLVANIFLFIAYYLIGPGFMERLALWPVHSFRFEPWQVITYAFMHSGLAHLFFNMFGLFMFGGVLERKWGTRNFLIFYFASVLAAACAQLLWTSYSGDTVPTVGASGGVFGLLLGFALLHPRRRLFLIFLPIPMPAWLFVTLYGILELILGVTNSVAGIAHFAHLGGMAGGALVFAFWGTKRPARRPPQ